MRRKAILAVLALSTIAIFAQLALGVDRYVSFRLAPVAGLSLRVDSTTFIASPGQTFVIDRLVLSGQATSTASTIVANVMLSGGVGKLLVWTKTVDYVFGAEEGVSGNWYNKVFDGPFPCTTDSPLVFHVYGTNTDSIGVLMNYHYAR